MSIEQVDARDWRTTESVDFLYADIWDLRWRETDSNLPFPNRSAPGFEKAVTSPMTV
jgi:hypothetical protein